MGKTRILIVEDESSLAKQLKWALSDTYAAAVATNAGEALAAMREEPPAAVLLDLGLPPDPDGASEGIRLLREIVSMKPGAKVIVITGNTLKDIAVQAVSLGAYDFHQKPVNIEELKIVLKRACYLSGLEQHVQELEEAICDRDQFGGMVAISRPMMDLFEKARKVARTDYPV
ncbi:MAG TPA: response regulator, partial [Deltaproteobacteria bacterium]|nr:response regulator [Deltaproteobacteria bacterium]